MKQLEFDFKIKRIKRMNKRNVKINYKNLLYNVLSYFTEDSPNSFSYGYKEDTQHTREELLDLPPKQAKKVFTEFYKKCPGVDYLKLRKEDAKWRGR